MNKEAATGTELPEGKTCRDCVWIKDCLYQGLQVVSGTYCRFSPSRFLPSRRMSRKLDTDSSERRDS